VIPAPVTGTLAFPLNNVDYLRIASGLQQATYHLADSSQFVNDRGGVGSRISRNLEGPGELVLRIYSLV
jgi:hypothetical protein